MPSNAHHALGSSAGGFRKVVRRQFPHAAAAVKRQVVGVTLSQARNAGSPTSTASSARSSQSSATAAIEEVSAGEDEDEDSDSDDEDGEDSDDEDELPTWTMPTSQQQRIGSDIPQLACSEMTLSWGGGEAPYRLEALEKRPESEGIQHYLLADKLNVTQIKWTVDVPLNSTFKLRIMDAGGHVKDTAITWVVESNNGNAYKDTRCLMQNNAVKDPISSSPAFTTTTSSADSAATDNAESDNLAERREDFSNRLKKAQIGEGVLGAFLVLSIVAAVVFLWLYLKIKRKHRELSAKYTQMQNGPEFFQVADGKQWSEKEVLHSQEGDADALGLDKPGRALLDQRDLAYAVRNSKVDNPFTDASYVAAEPSQLQSLKSRPSTASTRHISTTSSRVTDASGYSNEHYHTTKATTIRTPTDTTASHSQYAYVGQNPRWLTPSTTSSNSWAKIKSHWSSTEGSVGAEIDETLDNKSRASNAPTLAKIESRSTFISTRSSVQ